MIVDIGCKFKRPAYYDDLLMLKTTVAKVTHVKIVHNYQLYRDAVLLAEGHSTLSEIRISLPSQWRLAVLNTKIV